MLENVRFEAGETRNDPALAAALADLADLYIDDAFASAHRRGAVLPVRSTGDTSWVSHAAGTSGSEAPQAPAEVVFSSRRSLLFSSSSSV